MSEKTPIVALQEYCEKKLAPPPHYTVSDFKDEFNLFTCTVRAIDQEVNGTGTTRQIAKHNAASNILSKLKEFYGDRGDMNVLHVSITSDYMKQLLNFCMENKHPYPAMEITDQSGPPNAPIFTALCRVGTIATEATGVTKAAAKQLAAQKALHIIKNLEAKNNLFNSVVSVEQHAADMKNVMKEYRRIVQRSSADMSLQNRHNYFKEMHPNVKQAAWKVINDYTITSSQTRAELLLKFLEIKYKMTHVRNRQKALLPFIELGCELDVVFVNTYEQIFNDIVDYLRDML